MTVAADNERGPFASRLLPWLLAGAGMVGLAAALILTVEKIALLRDPDYIPTCSINPVLSCGSIMSTPQAEAFGFPNPLLGIAGFAVVTTVGVGILAGARFARWFWLGLQAGVTFGVVFVHWLIYQSLYKISALCPYCMIVWAVTIPIFWYTTLYNLQHGHLPVPDSWRAAVRKLAGFHTVVLTVWYLAIAVAVLQAFWDYWMTLL
ncbi:vitamin K epoxide reductase family protein [Amycolatopsis roodepoortensis]|uniref:vitamin K epoxide reductase family protein n=1 Tax=Amycolatopsis roodepoortensis TaxID=700274 RepID=UPI00214CCA1C|nr:vitamin K epoxide reductase family protein [Amycolatopsis roodepoortensis]UUV35874.1 vitamin K epoxide reductase family protein [Amycolatopsis roodepoortensis]